MISFSFLSGAFDDIQQPRNISEYSKNTICFFMFVDEETEAYLKNNSGLHDSRKVGIWRIVVVHNLPYTDGRRNGKVLAINFIQHLLFWTSGCKFGLMVVCLVIDDTIALIIWFPLASLWSISWMEGRCIWLNELDFFHHFQNRKVLCNNDQLLLPTPIPASLLPPIDKTWTSFFFFSKSAADSWFSNVYVTLDCTLAYLVNLVLFMAGPKASIA